MADAISVAVLSGAVAVGSSLLTIFLTPKLQHHFWRHQRRAELQIAAINEVNRLAAEFLTEYIQAPSTHQASTDFHKALMMATANLKPLFSDTAFEAFKAMEVMIGGGGPGLGPEQKLGVHDFIEARDALMRRLYEEVIL